MNDTLVNRAKKGAHFCIGDIAFTIADSLVQQGQAVPDTALGCPAQLPQCRFFIRDLLFIENMLDVLNQSFRAYIFQIELQATRQYGDRQLLRISCREQEFNVWWRLFKGF